VCGRVNLRGRVNPHGRVEPRPYGDGDQAAAVEVELEAVADQAGGEDGDVDVVGFDGLLDVLLELFFP
jgi:hypothetical protein